MTDFRPQQSLHEYSGGTVRELHTILYSPAALLPHCRHSNVYSLAHRVTLKIPFVNQKQGIEFFAFM